MITIIFGSLYITKWKKILNFLNEFFYRRSSRENYGDSAVGYVSVKRDNKEGSDNIICTVKGGICPEHKTHDKPYRVTLIVDETEDQIMEIKCLDCAASEGKK